MARKNKNKKKNSPQISQQEEQLPAIVASFNEYLGAGDLGDWQRLCSDIFYDHELQALDLSSKTKCRKALKAVFINIQDFVDAVEENTAGAYPKVYPQRFPSHTNLVKYTLKTRRIYPKEWVKNGLGPVKTLLREILHHHHRG
ncbi:hypothetical protein QBC36DRAFT_317368 [Triangularia setosa]|uniref:Uncharacterized protein n=1 Tax=Triangularia setosa TaxID=2587417 RepID=A0AAN7ADB0_9PEZI|nr:hypothetical protein QBC36DRAFT_317368 [Podospora setosa]